ncbi:sensor histidine kinase [Lacisediminihabitans changchengi]|uniref:histidine kinase n=1 Tax=Lacisediminihabitans changchengi TaxID=2787634 RepID=A0A934SPZ3_9MICO|nr:ATP-binding protein [Lacisediminihabitans changchengi]MBK4349107.1 HAMP domain-containing protein [Lacisediminihabitans changchengi]
MTSLANRVRAPWTLRRRLVFSFIALLAVGSIVIGLVSALTLQGVLMSKLDAQLEGSSRRAQDFQQNQGQGPSAPPANSPGGPGQNVETIFVVVRDGVLERAGYLDQIGTNRTLTASQVKTVLSVTADTDAQTVNLGGSLGQYRVLVTTLPDGDIVASGLPLASTQSTVYLLLAVIAGIVIVVLVVAFFVGRLLVQIALRPLERVVSTATHVSKLPLDRGEVALEARVPASDADPRTEVGQVGAAINSMLGHVASALTARQASENKVRKFVADASHELRTPLASIRGYAELTRRGNHELPDDVVHSIGRVESEATRMTSLVEDLLLLARLDEGRDLERNQLDLSRLLIDAVSDAHAAGPDHSWSIDLPEEPVVMMGDQQRLHQVLANLLANARVHTPAGTAVTVALSMDAENALVSVVDDGPGIPDGLQLVLFERFARGDSSRSRAAGSTGLGSTGLGLAIVSAVIEGHGGTVTVASVPGRTEFRVTLPLGS